MRRSRGGGGGCLLVILIGLVVFWAVVGVVGLIVMVGGYGV